MRPRPSCEPLVCAGIPTLILLFADPDRPTLAATAGVGAAYLGGQANRSETELTIADTGAGLPLITSDRYAKPGTIVANTTAISSANGVIVPKFECQARIPIQVRRPSGALRQGMLQLPRALIVPQCAHNLVPVGGLARTHGLGLTIKPWTGEAALSIHNKAMAPAGSSIELITNSR